MVGPSSQFATALVLAGILSLVSAGVAWRKRARPAGLSLVVFQLILAVSLFSYAADIESTSRSAQIGYASLWLVTQAMVSSGWVYVALEYSGLHKWSNWKTAVGLAVEPVLLGLVLAIPGLRQFLLTYPETGTSGSIVHVGIEPQPLWFVHFGILFVFLTAGTVLFVQLFVRSRHLYRVQTGAVLVAAIAPWITLLTGAFGFFPDNDPTALSWSLVGIVLTVGLYRFKTLDPVPAANETIVEQLGDGVIVLDEDDIVGDFNPAAREFLSPGPADTDIVGKPISDLFDGWDEVSYDDDGATAWQEISLTVDGERRYLEAQVTPFFNRFDVLVGRLVVLRDVTARTERERTLARFKTIFESVSDRVYVLGENGTFQMVNEPFAELVGIDRESLVGQPFEAILAGDTDGPAPDANGTTVEVTIETSGGDHLPCEIRESPISFDSAETGVVGILRDVSRRKELEASLRETTQQLETLVEASPQAIVGTDPDGNVEVWNDAATEMFGWTATEVDGEFLPVAAEEYDADLEAIYDTVADGEQVRGREMELERKDGSRLDGSVSIAPVTDDTGTVYGTVAVITDITTQRERERTLQRQNERLDEFASLVSHDLRNPLQVARTHLEIVMHADDPAENRDSIEKAQSALDRVETLIDDSLTLAREGRDIDDPRPIALERIATSAWENVQTDGARLELRVGTDATIEGDPSRVTELFENLFRNAVEHGSTSPASQGQQDAVEHDEMASGGPQSAGDAGPERWDAETAFGSTNGEDASENTPAGDQFVVRVVTTPDGFAVEDSGVGLPASERDELLEAGYTTADGGTGFGLAIVDRIADAHGWEITVTESQSGGARFEFHTDVTGDSENEPSQG